MAAGSPNYDASYDITKFYETLSDSEGVEFTGFLNALLSRGIRSIRGYVEFTWRYGLKIENVAYRFHGTTTTYPYILMYNGIVSPFEIQSGTVLRIPDKTELSRVLARLLTANERRSAAVEGRVFTNVGQVVTI